MKQLIEKFNQADTNIEKRVQALKTEIEVKTKERIQTEGQYAKAMLEDTAGTKVYSTGELNKLKQIVDELNSEIKVSTERLEMLQSGKPEQLKGMIPDIKVAREHELEGLNTEIQKIFEEARELRAKLTIKLAQGSPLIKKANDLLRLLNNAESAAGVPHQERTTTLGVPNKPPLTHPYQRPIGGSNLPDDCVLPNERELEAAYVSGELPLWIQDHVETSELLDGFRQLQVNEVEKKEKGVIGRIFSKQ